jgi:signal peptidase II
VSATAGARSARSAWTRAAIVLAVVLAVDQIAKALVVAALARGEEREIVAGIKLVNTRNSGVAFGQLQNGGVIVAIVIALAVCALLVYFARHARLPLMWLPTGMLLGGALGNVVDRIREGAVIDFLKLPHWPAFNVADTSITFGVVILLVVFERAERARARASA